MNSKVSVKKKIFYRFSWTILFFLPLISSCSPKQSTSVEFVAAPIYPKEFSSIPDQTKNPQLMSLLSADEKIKNISVGRDDPFLPTQSGGKQISVPDTFKYHGQIALKDIINVFVSYKNLIPMPSVKPVMNITKSIRRTLKFLIILPPRSPKQHNLW